MSRKTRYMRLETDPESSQSSDDDAPPTNIPLHTSQYVKESKWNHIENLDEFFDWVYQYLINHGLFAIVLNDILELGQFAFLCIFSAFLITCINFKNLFADDVYTNETGVKDVAFGDVIEIDRLEHINPLLVLILFFAFIFWFHRLCKTIWRFFKFLGIRRFYIEALNIPPSDLRNYNWRDVLERLKLAQNTHKMNIRKQELTEIDVYHRILRFKNYLVAMINKDVLSYKIWIPFYGEKVFFTMGLKYNYELLLFWGPGAPFKNNYHLHEEYKTAAKKHELVQKLRFRIAVLALVNLVFSPFIFLYQILYSFFTYAELLKRQPGVFGRRRWSLFGKIFLRHFNELDHELIVRLNRAYLPAGKYMDLFVLPVATILARNIAFIAGSLLAVLFTLTVIQEDLLTAHNILTAITGLGVIVTLCRIFIPNEHQTRDPKELMTEILEEIHYMPHLWKEKPHTVQVSSQFSQVFQLTITYLIDELLSPLVTPFILYFTLRNKSQDIIDFLRNFTIDVSGVGDVCSFAEMNLRKHGHSEWQQNSQLARSTDYERSELGKTEISLLNFTQKNPSWEAGEDADTFLTQLKESVEELHSSQQQQSLILSREDSPPPLSLSSNQFGVSRLQGSMDTSIWASFTSTNEGASSSLTPLKLHQVHDVMKTSHGQPSSSSAAPPVASIVPSYHPPPPQSSEVALTVYDHCLPSDSSLSSADIRLESTSGHIPSSTGGGLTEPFLPRDSEPPPQT